MPIARKPIYIGIDPGKTGAIAVLRPNLGDIVITKIPETDRGILDLLEGYTWEQETNPRPIFAVLERVTGYIGDDSKTRGSAMFNFGVGYGALRMALSASKIPFQEVMSTQWIRKLGLGTKGKRSNPEWKAYLYQKAQQLYPSASFPKYAADAVLIATFCKRKEEGTL